MAPLACSDMHALKLEAYPAKNIVALRRNQETGHRACRGYPWEEIPHPPLAGGEFLPTDSPRPYDSRSAQRVRAWLVGSSIETFDEFVRLPRASIQCLKNIAIRLRACAHWRRTMYFTIIAIDI